MAFPTTQFVTLVAVICVVATVHADGPLLGYHAYHDGNYYLFSTTGLSWQDAREACADQGGHLVEIGSGEEQTFLESVIAQIPGGHHHRWIGLNDLQREGHFVWESTGRSGFYRNWHPDQPDNHPDTDDEFEHCAQLWHENKWNDGRCSWSYRFICEL